MLPFGSLEIFGRPEKHKLAPKLEAGKGSFKFMASVIIANSSKDTADH
jgi:hypothetical protein